MTLNNSMSITPSPPDRPRGKGSNMGQFSAEKPVLPGSLLSGNQHKGSLAASFAAVRVRIADGPPQRIHDKGMQHMPGEEAWLVGERRASGERKYYLSNLPADADLKTLAAAIKARWVCEQAHQQLKEELGLDHFEGRSWHGLHRHALMTMIAYAYLQTRRLAKASGGKKNPQRAAAADVARDPARRPIHPRSRAALSMPTLHTNLPKISRMNLPK
jgi:Transposase DDE domain